MRFHTQLSVFFVVALSLLSSPNAQAQRNALPNWEVRAGVGLLPTFLKDHVQSDLPPLSLELRYKVSRRYSLGLLAGQSVSQASFQHHTGAEQFYKNRFSMVAIRSAVHSSPWEKWELYGGMLLGYAHSDITYMEDNEIKQTEGSTLPGPRARNGLFFSAFIGTSCQVHDELRVFGELGYGLSLLTTGVSYRF